MITVRIIMKSHQLSSPRNTNEECLISEEQEVSVRSFDRLTIDR